MRGILTPRSDFASGNFTVDKGGIFTVSGVFMLSAFLISFHQQQSAPRGGSVCVYAFHQLQLTPAS